VEKWRLALEMIDEIAGWGIDPPVILADGAYGDNTQFRSELQDRGISYVLDAKATTSAYPEGVKPERPAYQGRGQPPKARYRQKPSSLLDLTLQAGTAQAKTVTWREGTRGEMTSRFLALRVRPANIKLRNQASRAGEEIPLCWLICEWPEDKDQPVKYWLSNLPENTPIENLVRLGKMRWRIEHDYRELKDALGLDHFEGRSWRGFNHHITLVSVAHAFLTLERRRRDHRPRLRAAA
jgi:SRSO17 transposase